MTESVDDIRQILLDDLDPEIIEFLSKEVAWEYSRLYDQLSDEELLSDVQRSEFFSNGRGKCATKAMARAADRFGIPIDLHRLSCNGQNKLLLQIGRLIILQEPVNTRFDDPKAADYKVELASMSSTIRQLEFDFGDGSFRSPDWSGGIFAVLQHAAAGPRFTRDSKKLGALLLAAPDAGYTHWVQRIDLLELAMHGRAGENPTPHGPNPPDGQEDNVFVTSKRKNFRKAQA